MTGIPIDSVDCNPTPPAILPADWNDLLWAAITVGRPNRYYVLKHGTSSLYEVLFRASLVRMAVESSPGGTRFNRTGACKSLDPSEKGAINYFLGLTLCKLFAEKQLSVPWLLHLDVFRTALNPVLLTTERSRPDLVGCLPNNDWIAFEAKGRVSAADAATKEKAKDQARRVVSVLGRPVTGHYAGVSYFKKETLSFFVQDPPPLSENDPKSISLKGNENELFKAYYEPFVSLIASRQGAKDLSRDGVIWANSEEMDAEVGMRSDLFNLASREQWAEVAITCREDHTKLAQSELHADGLSVKCGASWEKRIKRPKNLRTDDE